MPSKRNTKDLMAKAAAKQAAEAEEQATVRELRSTIGRLERQIRKLRTKEDIIQDAILQVFDGGRALPKLAAPRRPDRDRRRDKHEQIAILHLSDWQLGKITKSYDSVVAEERALALIEKACRIAELRRSISPVRKLRIYVGGDMVEGEDIFPHQAHEIDSPLFDQACVNGPRILTKVVLYALEHFEHVWVGSVDGNHGRNGPRHTRSSPKTNWDRVMSNTARTLLLGTAEFPRKELAKRLDFHISPEFYFVDRLWQWGNLVVHGHQISGGFAGHPWYGAAKKTMGWIDTIEEPWDNLFYGHFHTPAMATLGHRRWYCNGTLESDNGFAKETLASAGVPTQRLFFMNEKYGIISDDPIELVSRRPSAARFTMDDLKRFSSKQ